MKNKNTKIVALIHGFYIFGEEVEAPAGFIKFVNAAMFGGFSGGKGMPGVARGDSKATVNLDQFLQDQELIAPLSSVVFIIDCVDLFKFKGTTLR
jgi:hypothetical protein